MKFKFKIKHIILPIVALVLIGVMIAGNIVLNMFAPVLHPFFAPAAESTGGSGGGAQDGENAYAYAARISEESAEDSIVLLENKDNYLPLSASTKFNIFGWGGTDQGFLLSGGGSGGTNTQKDPAGRERFTLLKAFQAAGLEYNEALSKAYSDFDSYDSDYRPGASGATNSGAYNSNPGAAKAATNPGADFYTSDLIDNAKNYSQDAIVVLSRWGNENGGSNELKNLVDNGRTAYANGSYLQLTEQEKAMFAVLEQNGFNVTVLLNTTNYIEMGFLDDYTCIKAVMYIGAPGQAGAKAIPNLLVGKKTVNGEETDLIPSGRISDTIANQWNDPKFAPSLNNSASGRTNFAYKEGIYVGYRWYETAEEVGYFEKNGKTYYDIVRYPFGYGLSYTTFSQTIKEIECAGKAVKDGDKITSATAEYTVTVTVTNTGKNYAGKDVVQLYYSPEYKERGIEKASINLLAFGKTGVIAPGDSEDVKLTFTGYDMASYDMSGEGGYVLDSGDYELRLMQNAHDYCDGEKVTVLLKSDGIEINEDPFTGNEVKNLFTGSTAYANTPIDGGLTYLSRAGGFANYDQATTSDTNDKGRIDNYNYTNLTSEITEEVGSYTYASAGMPLMTLEDGSVPTAADLNGNSGATLMVDKDLLQNLIADPNEAMWQYMLDSVKQEEIITMIANSSIFHIAPLSAIAKPQTQEKDGPSGFNDNTKGGEAVEYPFYPIESLLGCSWDINMMREIGRAQGMVGVQEKIQGWYAPGVNLHRSPYNSRNYEYFSEDGVLSGWLAAGIVNGAKEKGVFCYVKHFAMAESGDNSKGWVEWTTEQTLREVYCKPFELAVKISIDPDTDTLKKNVRVSSTKVEVDGEMKDALKSDPNGRPQTGANAMMSAFNCIGAVWSGFNHALLTDMLRTEWGFQGSVITDYCDQDWMRNYDLGVKAGNNLWMNNTNQSGARLNFSDPEVAYAARQTVKGILFTYLDTIYTSGLETTVAAEKPFSVLFVTLWALIDVVLGIGIALCVLFFFWSPRKKKKAAVADGEVADDAADNVVEQQAPEETPKDGPPTDNAE